MKREVRLLSFLPPFLQEFKEYRAALEAEDPEFVLVWQAADRVLQNTFIETADESGLRRFEKILGIFPAEGEDPETRRRRVSLRWFNTIPYTLRAFLEKLTVICADSDFTVTKEYLRYRIDLTASLERMGQVKEVDRLIASMMPCNMVVVSVNRIPCGPEGILYAAGAVCFVDYVEISDEG